MEGRRKENNSPMTTSDSGIGSSAEPSSPSKEIQRGRNSRSSHNVHVDDISVPNEVFQRRKRSPPKNFPQRWREQSPSADLFSRRQSLGTPEDPPPSEERTSHPLAFTIDFGETRSNKSRSFGIRDSISKFAPPQKKKEENNESGENKSDGSGTGTYTVDDEAEAVTAARKSLDSLMVQQQDKNSPKRSYVEEWAGSVGRHQWATEKYLDETRSVVGAMEEKMNRRRELKRETSFHSDAGPSGYCSEKPPQSVRLNKAFNIRRGLHGYESEGQPAAFSRSDGGRFSLRAHASIRNNIIGKLRRSEEAPPESRVPPQQPQVQKPAHPPPRPKKLSIGAQQVKDSKETELANWQRRKNYDPLAASGLGNKNKKTEERKYNSSGGSSRGTPSPPVPQPQTIPVKSIRPLSARPPSPSLIQRRSSKEELHAQDSFQQYGHRLEALDTLVIATIASLSTKVRSASLRLLNGVTPERLGSSEEDWALVEELRNQLKAMESPQTTSPQNSPSRQLSTTLKNLKKLEQVIGLVERILTGDEEI